MRPRPWPDQGASRSPTAAFGPPDAVEPLNALSSPEFRYE